MKLSHLLYEDEYSIGTRPDTVEIDEITCNAYAVRRNALYVCLKESRDECIALLDQACENGASAAIVGEIDVATSDFPIPIFKVKNPRVTYAYLWSRHEGKPERRVRIIGVTGTNGKTSTAKMLTEIFSEGGYKTAYIGTLGCSLCNKSYHAPCDADEDRLSTMTTPDPDLLYPILRQMADDGAEYVVMEVSSHALALEKVAPISFLAGIFTNLTPEHLDFHKSMDAYLEAKSRLFSTSQIGILNADDAAASVLAPLCKYKSYLCGAVNAAEIAATEIKIENADGVSYILLDRETELPIFVPIPGSFTVYNSLLAAVCALKLGICPSVVQAALTRVSGITGRMERITDKSAPFSILIDYAHTPHALLSLLKEARRFRNPGGRILLLFGCGGDRDKSKRARMGRIAEEYADLIYVTSDNSRSEDPAAIVKDILEGISDKSKCRVVLSRYEAIRQAIGELSENDILLLVGKGHESYEIDKNGMHRFDERKIVKSLLEKRKRGDTVFEN